MYTVHFTVLAVLSVLGIAECTIGYPPVAGICRAQSYMQVDPLQFAHFVAILKYDIIQSTNNTPYNTVAQERREITYVLGNVFGVTDTRTYTDQTTDVYSYTATYTNFVGYENGIDKSGMQRNYRVYVLATYIDDDAILYYRCSDDGDPEVDARAIQVGAGKQLSVAGLNYLLEEDSKHGFMYGTVKALPFNTQS